MQSARAALAAGLALTAIAAAIVLSQSPEVVAGTNAIEPGLDSLASVPGSGHACQAGETLPAGSSAIRLSLAASAGPRIHVTVLSGNRAITHGESAPGWIGDVVTVPVTPVDHTVRDATVCLTFTGADELVSFLGAQAPGRAAATSGTGALTGRVAIEYLRRGSSSWWSLASGVARRMGLGRAWAGTWVVLLVAILMVASVAIASWLAVRDPR
jgi:hypothetical protein